MRDLGKILILIGMAAGLLLLYVHGKISLFHVSYAIDTDSEKLARLTEEYRNLKFEVEQLKAPRLLEQKMKQMSLNMSLPQEIRVIRVEEPLPQVGERAMQEVPLTTPFSSRMFNLLGRWGGDVAQAKTDR